MSETGGPDEHDEPLSGPSEPPQDPTVSTAPAPSERRSLAPAIVLVAAALVVAYIQHAMQHGSWQVDDAGITFAYARNIAMGYGPVTNPGDLSPNEGYSNPAWTVIMATFMWLGAFDIVWTPKILSGLFAVSGFGVMAWIVRRFDDGQIRIATVAPMALLVANGSWVLWSVGGLENPQYVTTMLLALGLYLRDVSRPGSMPVSGPVFFLTAISRPEGLMYTFAAGGDAVLRTLKSGDWRWLVKLVAGMAVPLGLYLTWHLWVYNDVLPNTYYAKSREASITSRLFNPRANGWQYLLDGVTRWGQGPVFLLAMAAMVDREAWRRGLGALVLALIGSVVFVLHANGDWMMQFRFMSTTFALAAVLAGVGLATLRRVVLPGMKGVVAEPVVLLATAAFVGGNLAAEVKGMLAKPTVPLATRIPRLLRLLEVADDIGLEEPVVLMSDMGGPMWVNDARQAVLIDMFGLCTKELAMGLHHRDVDALWSFGLEENEPAFMQFPPTLYDSWRLDVSVTYQDRYTNLDDYTRNDETTGVFIRRDLIEAPPSPRHVQGTVIVQRPVRVHETTVVRSSGGEAVVDVDFSLGGPTQVPPQVRILLRGDRDMDSTVHLFPSIRPTALAPDRVYRYRTTIAVPPDVGPVRSARAIGTPEPSPLPRTVPWQREVLVEGGAVSKDFTPSDPAGLDTADGVVFTADAGGGRLCAPPILWSDELRLRGRLAAPSLEGRLDLDTRWFGPKGGFLGRSRTWSWPQPFEERNLALAIQAPAEAHSVRVCWVFVEGGGEIRVPELAWERR